MPASLLPPGSPAAERSRELTADLADRPGLPQARLLAEYVLGRRSGDLDVSGRDTEGMFIDAEAAAEVPHEIIVVDDAQGLQAALLSEFVEVRAYNDRIDEARRVAEVAPNAEGVERLSGFGARVTVAAPTARETWAVVNAPKAMNSLAETLAALQPHVSTLIVIGRSETMSRAINKELARGFARVDVSPGVGKHRMIIGSRPLSSPSLSRFPKAGRIDHPATGPLEVRAHGACFSGVKNDEGSALLLEALAAEVAAGRSTSNSVLDLGCGNGWLLSAALQVTGADTGAGVDVSRAAVASARATAEANGAAEPKATAEVAAAAEPNTVDIVLGDAAGDSDPAVTGLGPFDLILLNPPFHQGTTIETNTAEDLMRTAAAHLAEGGRVLTVFNTHLRYRDRLDTLIGPSEQLARNSKFTVIASRRG